MAIPGGGRGPVGLKKKKKGPRGKKGEFGEKKKKGGWWLGDNPFFGAIFFFCRFFRGGGGAFLVLKKNRGGRKPVLFSVARSWGALLGTPLGFFHGGFFAGGKNWEPLLKKKTTDPRGVFFLSWGE